MAVKVIKTQHTYNIFWFLSDKKSGAPHVVEVEDPRHRGMVARIPLLKIKTIFCKLYINLCSSFCMLQEVDKSDHLLE